MAEFIVNPRRAPRAPARCRAAVIAPQGTFEAETEDIGSMGCQVVSPKQVRKGDMLQMHVTNEKLEERLRVTGRVAWVSPQAPWRVGIAFDDASLERSARWFEQLLDAYPGLGGFRRVPDRIRTDANVYLGAPPRFLVDFTADEAGLLRAIASGARVDELQARLRSGWPAAQRALFSLVARGAVTFQRGQAVHPDSWKKILTDVEASLAIESLAQSPPPPAPARPELELASAPAGPFPRIRNPDAGRPGAPPADQRAEGWGEAHDPSPLELGREGGLPPPIDLGTPTWVERNRPAAQPDFSGAGVGWRQARQRSPAAQAEFDSALAELAARNINGALAHLRRAIALAPGDPEIAAELGKLAFKRG